MKPPRNRNINPKSNTQLGKLINKSFESTSVQFKPATVAVLSQSNVLSQAIKDAIGSEQGNLTTIESQLNLLSKSSVTYRENSKILIALKNEAIAKLSGLVALSDNIELSTKLTEKLINEFSKNSDNKEVIENQTDKLAEINEKIAYEFKAIKENRTSEIKSKEQEKLDKKLNRIDKRDQFGKNTGIHQGVSDMLMGSIFGPLGKPLSEAFNISGTLFNSQKKKEKLKSDSEKRTEKILSKLEKSGLLDQDKRLIQAKYQNEVDNRELEEDRTQDFRSETLALQKDLIKKTGDNSSVLSTMLTFMAAQKVASLAKGGLGLLSAAITPVTLGAAIAASLVKYGYDTNKGNIDKGFDWWEKFKSEDKEKHRLASMSPQDRVIELQRKETFKAEEIKRLKSQNEKDFGLANSQLEAMDNLPVINYAKQNASPQVVDKYNTTIKNLSNNVLNKTSQSISSLMSSDIITNMINSYKSVQGDAVQSFPMPNYGGANSVPIPMLQPNQISNNSSNQSSGRVNIDQIQPVIDDDGLNAINLQTIGK